MARAYVNIGSNIGDRRANIARAVTALSALAHDGDMMVSEPYESASWGYESPNAFVNVGVSFSTALSPEALLAALLEAQRGISEAPHRTPDGGYADRLIDIDLIAMEGVSLASSTLTLPHPRASRRPFVMQPLLETLPLI